MNTYMRVGVLLVAVLIAGSLIMHRDSRKETVSAPDYKNISYMIEGKEVQLVHGVAETETVPGSASKTITRYFGNDFRTDLDGDGQEDIVFLVTQETGGSGVFFYVVAARRTASGYEGSDGYLLGDRIAPQSIDQSRQPGHERVIVVNYAERASTEPMTAAPSIGKSVYLKLDAAKSMWAIVLPNFEGESR